MRRFPAMAVLAIMVLSVGFGSAQAQSARRFSLQASGLYVGVFGSAFEGVNGGGGFEAQARYNPSAFSIGAGYQASIHSWTFNGGSEDLNFAGAFVEPRYVIDVGSAKAAPYLAARVAFLQQTADVTIQGTAMHLSASGTQLNLGGGALIRVSPAVNLDLGATFGRIHFAEVKADVPGFGSQTFDTGAAGDGQNLVIRVGVAIGIGR